MKLKEEHLQGFEITEHEGWQRPFKDYTYEDANLTVDLTYRIDLGYFETLDVWVKTQPDNYVIRRVHFSEPIHLATFKDVLSVCGIDYSKFLIKKVL